MSDFQELNAALEEYTLEEGALARNRMVWKALRAGLDSGAKSLAGELSDIVINEQRIRGVHQPSCGELIAAEVLFQVWLLAKEKEEVDGTD